MLQGMKNIFNANQIVKWLSWFEATTEISLVILVKLSNRVLIAHPWIKKLIKKIVHWIFYYCCDFIIYELQCPNTELQYQF